MNVVGFGRLTGVDFAMRGATRAVLLGCVVIFAACTGPKTVGSPDPAVAPAITAQPESQSVTAGATATFAVTATGSAPLSYQWSKDGATISGATGESYTTPATVPADAGSAFSVEVTNATGNVASNAATLTVTATSIAPSITAQPANQSVTVGAAASFSVSATGTAPLSYQWSKNGTAVAGATAASYATPATVVGDNGASFTVRITNGAGSAASRTATLTVSASAVAPSIITPPTSKSVTVGAPATFNVSAAGTAPLSYQWSKNGTAISGATAASYTTPAAALADSGASFTVKVSNAAGNAASAAAILTVDAPPTITAQPRNQSVAVGAKATFSVVATGTAPLKYQWSKSGARISGATAASYTTPATASSDNNSTYSVNVANAYGTVNSSAATLIVGVTGAASVNVTPILAPLTASQTQQFTASVAAAGITANWSVDGTPGGTASTGTITSGGLYTPGTLPGAVGTHVITATNASDTAQSGTATVAVTDLQGIYSFHNDDARTGQNLHEPALTAAVLKSGNFGKLWSCALDGAVYAQPLYVANVAIGGNLHNVVYVATQHDSVYAFDADKQNNCIPIWAIHLTAGDGSVTSVPAADTGCGDTPGEIGITGTPVIDADAASASPNPSLYFVAKTRETRPSNPSYFQRLHRVSIATGVEQPGSPVAISATVATNTPGSPNRFDTLGNNQKPGLAFANNTVYIGWSSHCDRGSYVGWFMSYDRRSLSQTGVFPVTPTTYGGEGGIWMSGGAPAVDSSGSVYISTGNGAFSGSVSPLPPLASPVDLSMSFIRFNPGSLAPTDFYSPGMQATWSQGDFDISSSGVTALPAAAGSSAHPNLLFGSDKQDHLWLLDRDNMGGFSTITENSLQFISGPLDCAQQSCVFSTPAYHNKTLYLGITGMGIVAMPISNGLIGVAQGKAAFSSRSADSFGFPGPTPTISAASPNGEAVVWALETSQNGSNGAAAGPAVLRAYDAANLATQLYSSANDAADTGPNAVKFTVPVVANGRVYVGGVKEIAVYGHH